VPHVVPIPHPETFHNHLRVVQDECAHHGESNQELHIDESRRSQEHVENGSKEHCRQNGKEGTPKGQVLAIRSNESGEGEARKDDTRVQ